MLKRSIYSGGRGRNGWRALVLGMGLCIGLVACIQDGGEAGFFNQQGIDALGNDHYEEARLSFEEALKRNPEDGVVWGNLGVALTRLQRYPEALDAYQKSQQLVPNDPITAAELGSIYYRLGQYGEAESHYRQAIQLEPRAPEFHSSLALALLRQDKQTAAREAMDKARKNSKGRPLVAYQYAAYQLLEGDREAGLDAFKQALVAYPDGRRSSVADADFASVHDDPRYQQLVAGWWKAGAISRAGGG